MLMMMPNVNDQTNETKDRAVHGQTGFWTRQKRMESNRAVSSSSSRGELDSGRAAVITAALTVAVAVTTTVLVPTGRFDSKENKITDGVLWC